ncbi:MAG TPA: carboxypeptidase regulatory-like domain-containing protein [Candidatus Aminicenantes bacterium]|nr:carboxypeptidase regulatory-like domain-containing protein [Candidatus Aminicenantes bacterium]
MKHPLRALAVLISLAALALPPLAAQSPRGSVAGKVVGADGKPLGGVTVILSRPRNADLKARTDPAGRYRFPAVLPAADYTVRAEHPERRTASRANVIVRIGGRSTVDLVMEPGQPEEQTAVTSPFPAIDPARMRLGLDLSRAELQTLPAPRDPWIGLQLVPAVMADRENIGGTESTGPAVFTARGDVSNGATNVWRLDGADIGDPVVLGRPAVSFDLDAVDSISVTTGGAFDVTVPTGGIVVNALTRRGDNRPAGSARFYLTDAAFQSSNLTSALRNEGVAGTDRIEQIKDYGANLGGPIVKNRIWLWGSFGVSDIRTYNIYNRLDQALLGNASVKLDIQPFAGNRFEALFLASSKTRYGADASFARPEGYLHSGRFRLGNPVIRLQDEQAFGRDLVVSLKLTAADTGSRVRPGDDEHLDFPVTIDAARGVYVPFAPSLRASWDSSSERRARKGFEAAATLYKDGLLGLAHEFKGGFEFADKSLTRQAGYFQNFQVTRNFAEPLIDLGEGLVVPPSDWQHITFGRETRDRGLASQASAYLQDTISAGRLTLVLGFRYDRQKPSTGAYGLATVLPQSSAWKTVFAATAIDALGRYLPPLPVGAVDPRYRWSTWSPRAGLSWDVKGDGRTVAKLSFAQYGDIMAPGDFTAKPLGLGGALGFWWRDANGNERVDPGEAYWQHSHVHPEAPDRLYAFLDSNGYLTDEAMDALEGGFESDAYLAGNYRDFDWADPKGINYDYLTTFYRSDIDPEARNVKTSPRTREVVLSLEKELRPDLTASIAATYRRYDNFDWAKLFYPADIFPSTPDLVIDDSRAWYVPAGTVPAKITVTDDEGHVVKEYDLLEAGGKTWYLPGAAFPGETPYRLVDKSKACRTYFGLDLGLTKRLSRRWMAAAAVTLQDQRLHWNGSFIDPTNQWALDGQPYGNWAAGTGDKAPVQMHARWMAKVHALYQMPWGITAALTFQAREGWKVPHSVTLSYADGESWDGLYRSNTVYLQAPTKDRLPNNRILSFRLEKSMALGSGRVTLMADVFNVFNWAIVNRAYDAHLGTYFVDTGEFVANPASRLPSEVLNPRVMRLGVRFDF